MQVSLWYVDSGSFGYILEWYSWYYLGFNFIYFFYLNGCFICKYVKALLEFFYPALTSFRVLFLFVCLVRCFWGEVVLFCFRQLHTDFHFIQVYILTRDEQSSSFLHSLPFTLLFLFVLKIDILTSVSWKLNTVLICISLCSRMLNVF